MDSIRHIIAKHEKLISDLEAQIKSAHADLAALKRTEEILNGVPRALVSHFQIESGIPIPPVTRKGKQAGAISRKWRMVLSDMLPVTSRHTLDDIKAAAEMRGIEAQLNSVRDRMRKLSESHFAIEHDDGLFSVTETAVERFGLGQNETPSPSDEEEEDE